MELQTEYPPPALECYGIHLEGVGLDATGLLKILVAGMAGWVKVGNPLPAEYTPSASYVKWAGSTPALTYRDNRDALIQLLGGDTVHPSDKVRAERQAILDLQNQLQSTFPKINLAGICGERNLSETLTAISFITGCRISLTDSQLGLAPTVSLFCKEVGVPGLLKLLATALNSPIIIGEAMPLLPLEAIPDWIKEAAPDGLYLYSSRHDLISSLGGEKILPVADWALLF